MTCEKANDLFPDYLTDTLDEPAEHQLQVHLTGCAGCRQEADRLRATWKMLGLLPSEKPTPALRARFYDSLEAYTVALDSHKARWSFSRWFEKVWPRQPMFQFAVALSCAVLGVAAGRYVFAPGPGSPKQEPVEMSRLREEVSSMRQLVTLSLLQQQSAADRMRGVTYSYHVQPDDTEVLSALLQTLNHDTNVNVRLSAVDALKTFASSPVVRKGMVQALPKQDSPMVQIALIDALTDLRERDAVPAIRALESDASTNVAVKQRAEWALQRIQGGSQQ